MRSFLNKLAQIIKRKVLTGNVVYLECNLFGLLYKIQSRNPEKTISDFLNIFLNIQKKKGLLITPSFSYSWGNDKKNKKFDIYTTKSTSGVFSEYIRNRKIFIRTNDPMFSCLIFGNKKKFKFLNSNNSFGKDSVYSYLHKKNAFLINFGLNKFDPTFVHYVEQFFDENFKKIKYRKLFKLRGKYGSNKKIYTHFSFLRSIKSKYTYEDKNILNNMIKQKNLYSKKIFGEQLYICRANDFFKSGIQGLKKNNNFFIKKEEDE